MTATQHREHKEDKASKASEPRPVTEAKKAKADLEGDEKGSRRIAEPTMYGTRAQDAVRKHRDEVAKATEDLGIILGPLHTFDLAFDAFDPQTGEIVVVVQPRRRDIGQEAITLSPDDLRTAIAQVRTHMLMLERVNAAA